MKIPNLSRFLKNGSNKDAMLQITEQVIQQEWVSLVNRVVYIARETTCVRISNSSCESIPQLGTDHMEVDTMLSYLIAHSLEMDGQCAVVRSANGDTVEMQIGPDRTLTPLE